MDVQKIGGDKVKPIQVVGLAAHHSARADHLILSPLPCVFSRLSNSAGRSVDRFRLIGLIADTPLLDVR